MRPPDEAVMRKIPILRRLTSPVQAWLSPWPWVAFLGLARIERQRASPRRDARRGGECVLFRPGRPRGWRVAAPGEVLAVAVGARRGHRGSRHAEKARAAEASGVLTATQHPSSIRRCVPAPSAFAYEACVLSPSVRLAARPGQVWRARKQWLCLRWKAPLALRKSRSAPLLHAQRAGDGGARRGRLPIF